MVLEPGHPTRHRHASTQVATGHVTCRCQAVLAGSMVAGVAAGVAAQGSIAVVWLLGLSATEVANGY